MSSASKIVAIVGATATGKSSLGLDLAERVGGEIVNADALQVYRGLDIGTAKPTPADQRRIRHHLIDVLDPHQRYSAGEFVRRATAAIEDIESRGRVPILVGGSGLYLRALGDGLAAIPEVSAEIRRDLRARLEIEGRERLYGELEGLDPETAARLAVGDSQRILRALEIVSSTGKTQSWWLRRQSQEGGLELRRFGLTLNRAILYDRIESRIDAMLSRGWLEEVRELCASGLTEADPGFQAIGYRQLARHLEGESSLEQARAEIVTATRRYAKRQETWFKKEPDVQWLDGSERERLLHLIEL